MGFGVAPANANGDVVHFLYSAKRLEVRLVLDDRPHADATLSDGVPIGGAVDYERLRYAPHFYVDTFSLLRRRACRTTGRARPLLRLLKSSSAASAPCGPAD